MIATRKAGFTLVELLVSLVVISIFMAGVADFYVIHRMRGVSEDMGVTVQQNLRLGMDKLVFALRNSKYGVPSSNLVNWVPWVAGFTLSPKIVTGPPDSISLAACGMKPFAVISSGAAAGATSLAVTDASPLNTTTQSLIYINDNEFALVQGISGNTLSIDTGPTVSGSQGLLNSYSIGTPVCRVDVTTFSVDTASRTLRVDANQGAGALPVADGITNMQITVNNAGASPEYTITLTGQSGQIDPATGAVVQATMVGKATPRK